MARPKKPRNPDQATLDYANAVIDHWASRARASAKKAAKGGDYVLALALTSAADLVEMGLSEGDIGLEPLSVES